MPAPSRIVPRRSLCVLLLLPQLIGCYTYRPGGTPQQQVVGESLGQARLSFRNGTHRALHDVTVRTDSVIGFAGNLRERRAMPVADVVFIERQQVSIRRTGALVVATAMVAYVARAIADSREHEVVPVASPATGVR